ncbi:MAG: hypothetical protein LC797_07685 [Chloroflexi bacterium]|nr:hypothetical protein [Chloroflexota bacterium]
MTRAAASTYGNNEGGPLGPDAFCASIGGLLAAERSDDGWVRGARALCDMYAGVEAQRFGTILVTMAAGRTGSAIAEGARWLLPRWQAVS